MEPTEIKEYESKPNTKNFIQWAKNAGTLMVFIAMVGLGIALIDMGNTQEELHATLGEVKTFQVEGRERTFKARAITCATVILDNDRTFPLSDDCTEADVVKYYPGQICSGLGLPEGCGSLFVPSPYDDPTVPDS